MVGGEPDGTFLGGVREELLGPGELAWHRMSMGLAADLRNSPGLGRELWKEARGSAVDGEQLKILEEFRSNALAQLQLPSEFLAEKMRSCWKNSKNAAEAVRAFRRYLLVLHRLGQTSRAIALLEEWLPVAERKGTGEVHGLYLLEALLRPEPSEEVDSRLLRIVWEDGEGAQILAALRLLSDRSANDPVRCEVLLRSLLGLPEPTAAAGKEALLRVRLQMAIRLGHWQLARSAAGRLLPLVRGENREFLQRLWLSLTLEKLTPDFAEIAATLHSFEADAHSNSIRASLLFSLASHFLRRGDGALARRFLDGMGEVPHGEESPDTLLLRIRISLALGDAEEAFALVRLQLPRPEDPSFPWPVLFRCNESFLGSLGRRWNDWLVECWNLKAMDSRFHRSFLRLLVENAIFLGDAAAAEEFLGEMETTAAPDRTELPVRPGAAVGLLRLRLAHLRRDIAAAESALRFLLEECQNSEETGKIFLLHARFLEEMGHRADAVEIIKTFLRERGQFSASVECIAEARLLLARLLAGGDGGPEDEAFAVLEELIRSCPDSPHAQRARLLEGDFLRLRHEFSAAATLYRTILHRSAGSGEAVFAELGLAKSLLADPRTPADLQEAVEVLERLHALSLDDPNVRIEIDCTLIFALHLRGNCPKTLLRRCWQCYAPGGENFLQLNSSGKFWLHVLGKNFAGALDPVADAVTIRAVESALEICN
ncbi:MAG: hypothetical protein LBS68_02255 [Puniceicoccales bacterium]|nr:hypothetical protein [Puniceicoccales bacterium]